MLQQSQLISLLNRVLGESARIRKGHEAVYYCPFCHHHKKKLEINLTTQNWHCWVCHAAGFSIRSFFNKLRVNRAYFDELTKIVGEQQYRHRDVEQEVEQVLELPKEFISLGVPNTSFEYGNAVQYLRDRGVTKCDILRYNIGYCETGEYSHRIVIPSYDKDGHINFFSARAYYDSYMKYKLPPWSKNIIGFELFVNWNEPITLVEGQLDAIAIRKNAIPLFGTTISNYLRESIIENKVKRVNIVLDNDALKSAIRIFDSIERFKVFDIDVRLIRLQDKDPSLLGFQKIDKIIGDSNPVEFADIIKIKMTL